MSDILPWAVDISGLVGFVVGIYRERDEGTWAIGAGLVGAFIGMSAAILAFVPFCLFILSSG